MFNSKARYINNTFALVWKLIMVFVSLIFSVVFILELFDIFKIIPQQLYLDKNNPWMVFLTNTLFFGSISLTITFIHLISKIVIRKICINVYVKECREIIDNTKLPDKLPKVLYIYTSHNDLIEARVLQNMQQTYKNFELWVSDGSDNLEWRHKIKEFCTKNKINLFQLGLEGSKNKADNINQFLKQYKKDYDYLLIGDADEVFNKNFVEYAVKMFLSDKVKNIGFISPLNVNYRSKGIYPNTTRFLETWTFTLVMLVRSFSSSSIPPLSGQSSLISRKSLFQCNKEGKFDEGNLEDWYLEAQMLETMNHGLMLPNAVCYYEPDVNIKAHFSRIMRVNDWIIRWWKIRPKNILKNYNEKCANWYKTYFGAIFGPFIIFFGISIIAFLLWIIIANWNYSFKNNLLFWIVIGIIIGFGLLYFVVDFILNISFTRKFFNFWDFLLWPIIITMWVLVANIQFFLSWFKALFLSKYAQFGGSGSFRFLKTKSKTLSWWLWSIFLTAVLVAFNVCIFLLINWQEVKWLIIFVNIYIGVIWLGCISYLILWYINFIPYNNSFKREDWIETKEIF